MRPVAVPDHTQDEPAPHDGAGTAADPTLRSLSTDGGAELLAMAAHDLRSPLATAQGYVELLREHWDDVDDGDRRHYLERIASHLVDLGGLLGDLLETSRSAAGSAATDPQAFDLGRLVRDVTAAFDDTNPDREITARIDAGGPTVTADRQAIARVLHNLLTNALAYSPAGSSVQVEVTTTGDEVTVAVRDQGRGISDEDQVRLFRRFSRVEQDGSGNGLGLYISQKLLEANGGRIWVDSRPGFGSTFTFSLPRG